MEAKLWRGGGFRPPPQVENVINRPGQVGLPSDLYRKCSVSTAAWAQIYCVKYCDTVESRINAILKLLRRTISVSPEITTKDAVSFVLSSTSFNKIMLQFPKIDFFYATLYCMITNNISVSRNNYQRCRMFCFKLYKLQ